jgi:hypothetical protein
MGGDGERRLRSDAMVPDDAVVGCRASRTLASEYTLLPFHQGLHLHCIWVHLRPMQARIAEPYPDARDGSVRSTSKT